MKIDYVLTEMGLSGKVPDNYPYMRVLETQIKALDAEHINIIAAIEDGKKYDGNAMVVLPKGPLEKDIIKHLVTHHFDTILKLKGLFNEVYFYQDGEIGYWNQHIVTLQLWWYNNLMACDKIMVPNVTDVPYYRGMFDGKKIGVVRSVMFYAPNTVVEKRNDAIISGPLTREYNGLEQAIVAKHCQPENIDVPPMGQERMPKDSFETANNIGIRYIQYMDWNNWMTNLSGYSYGVNMPGVTAAASFSLNCAFHGIPCIGDDKADTQRICFPETSVSKGDINSAVVIAKKLVNDKSFYDSVSKQAMENYRTQFNYDKFMELLDYE